MKKTIIAVIAIGSISVLAWYATRPPALPPVQVAQDEPAASQTQAPEPPVVVPAKSTLADMPAAPSTTAAVQPQSARAPLPPMPDVKPALTQVIDTLLSADTTYAQKENAWKQLKKANQLDDAIAELQRRAADDPRSAEVVAALAQGYLRKCDQTEDIRERAIFAMQADQTFDAALKTDPQNWDARYNKAAAMSYWPQELNRGQQVIEQFTSLIQQQETQPPQPQFARSYLRLGDQYKKTGRLDYAQQVWQRGAMLFPDNADFADKLASR